MRDNERRSEDNQHANKSSSEKGPGGATTQRDERDERLDKAREKNIGRSTTDKNGAESDYKGIGDRAGRDQG